MVWSLRGERVCLGRRVDFGRKYSPVARAMIKPPPHAINPHQERAGDGEALFNPGWKEQGKLLVPDSGPVADVERVRFAVKVAGLVANRNEGVE